MIQKRPTIHLIRHRTLQWIPQRMLHKPLLKLLLGNLPNLLDPQSEMLHVRSRLPSQVKFRNNRFGTRSSGTLGEESLTSDQLDAAFECVLRFAILGNAHIFRGNSLYRSVPIAVVVRVVIQDFVGGESGIDFHSHPFRHFAEVSRQFTQTDYEISVVVKLRWKQKVWNLITPPRFSEYQKRIFRDGRGVRILRFHQCLHPRGVGITIFFVVIMRE
mmetsp:Transcript_23056/g.43605  ORF Transcript_23056/g.43605 Transcript_23056/m.43605 type:complete len:216 (-) Transcript_23056:625-1272(-)